MSVNRTIEDLKDLVESLERYRLKLKWYKITERIACGNSINNLNRAIETLRCLI